MLRHALGQGMALPPDVIALTAPLDRPEPPTLVEVAALHGRLAQVIAPASPRTVWLLQNDPYRDSLLGAFGALPNIRRMLLATLVFLGLFILTSLSDQVNDQTVSKDMLELGGAELLLVLTFMICAAGLGACFHALYTAHGYVTKGTYDPRYDSSYWIKIVLGVVAGLLLSQVIPVEQQTARDVSMTKPLLALVGGFSAELVNTILQRLVQTIQSLFKGDPSESQDAKEKAMKAQADRDLGQRSLLAASDVFALREAVASGAPPEKVSALADQAIGTLLPEAADRLKQATTAAPAP
ncbi:hypothetical protein HHL28_05035 [Aerophototrophica crusticola]|uniref:Uncharacterized protein n=1 Tax=Aerophototrophica crusticola TaxID=1709002 RepID=A0A858R654_9PROT|nr:hypothetical protein HHL28_05035 [Rhodospirillaceae bacterium B3]